MESATMSHIPSAGRAAERSDFVNRLQALSKQEAKDVRDLLEALRKEKSPDERREIAKTLTEVLFPDSMRRLPSESDDEIEARARGRLDEYRTRVGIAVKQRREKLGLTQEQLAASAGLPQSHISRLERGKHVPTHVTMSRISKALKTKPSSLDPGFAD